MLRATLPLLLLLAFSAGAAADDKADAAPSGPPLWETKATLEGHKLIVRCASFDPAGRVLATGGSDRSLRTWDPDAYKALAAHVLPRSG